MFAQLLSADVVYVLVQTRQSLPAGTLAGTQYGSGLRKCDFAAKQTSFPVGGLYVAFATLRATALIQSRGAEQMVLLALVKRHAQNTITFFW